MSLCSLEPSLLHRVDFDSVRELYALALVILGLDKKEQVSVTILAPLGHP